MKSNLSNAGRERSGAAPLGLGDEPIASGRAWQAARRCALPRDRAVALDLD
jgi:hypothetical protein